MLVRAPWSCKPLLEQDLANFATIGKINIHEWPVFRRVVSALGHDLHSPAGDEVLQPHSRQVCQLAFLLALLGPQFGCIDTGDERRAFAKQAQQVTVAPQGMAASNARVT